MLGPKSTRNTVTDFYPELTGYSVKTKAFLSRTLVIQDTGLLFDA